jgi:hypothetical protein
MFIKRVQQGTPPSGNSRFTHVHCGRCARSCGNIEERKGGVESFDEKKKRPKDDEYDTGRGRWYGDRDSDEGEDDEDDEDEDKDELDHNVMTLIEPGQPSDEFLQSFPSNSLFWTMIILDMGTREAIGPPVYMAGRQNCAVFIRCLYPTPYFPRESSHL